MRVTCARMSMVSTASQAGHASVADRIALEAHLEECRACQDEHAELAVVGILRRWQPPGLPEPARERVRQGALRAARRVPAEPARRRLTRRVLLGAGSLAAAAVVALLLVPAENRVVAGDVEVVGSRGAGIPDGATLRAGGAGRAVFGKVTVDFDGDTQAVWSEPARAVRLARGRVTVEVTPGAGQHFQVVTPRFTVEVVGTHFAVDLRGVRTDRGTVHVKLPDGTLAATLTAGQSWWVPPPSASAPAPAATPLPGSASAAPPTPAATTPGAPMSKAPEDNPSPPAIPTSAGAGARSGADRMVRARRALTRGQADQARDLLLPLLRGPRSVAVEARALFAESYLIEGRYGDAVDGYRKVVRDFAGTPQAETALYAIAQLEVEASGREEAVQALRRYLARYPDGRFAREARERLERLAAPAGR